MTAPPEPKGYTPTEIFQKIKSENLWEVDLDLDPGRIPWIYIGNIIQRTLSRMVGQGPYGPVTVKCTPEGNLAVVSRGGAFDDYERLEYTFALSGAERTTDGTTAYHLIDSSEDFVAQGIKAGDTVKNTTDKTYAYVTAVAAGDLTLSADIMVNGETYELIPCYEFTFTRQVERIDIFTYDGKVDYQLTRDLIKAYGSKIELFEDSFYSLDFYTKKVRATVPIWADGKPQRVKLMGWFQATD